MHLDVQHPRPCDRAGRIVNVRLAGVSISPLEDPHEARRFARHFPAIVVYEHIVYGEAVCSGTQLILGFRTTTKEKGEYAGRSATETQFGNDSVVAQVISKP